MECLGRGVQGKLGAGAGGDAFDGAQDDLFSESSTICACPHFPADRFPVSSLASPLIDPLFRSSPVAKTF